jgi:hypothetical protein
MMPFLLTFVFIFCVITSETMNPNSHTPTGLRHKSGVNYSARDSQ